MKKDLQNNRLRFNLYLSACQANEIRRLFEFGLTLSAIARQAVRKCSEMNLEPDSDGPFPDRFNFHLDRSDAEALEAIAKRENSPKAVVLRRLIDTYLRINHDALARLF
jgi:hypothetical protein